jgi:phosphoglycolate phosphatase
MARTLVLDLDGTLVDSLPDITACLNRSLARHGLAPFEPAEVATMVGDGGGVLVRRAYGARGADAGEEAIASFIAEYTAHVADASVPYPGTTDALLRLQAAGWQLAVCTNKPELAARALLQKLGLEGAFSAVCGGDSFPVRKPHPDHLLRTIQAAAGDRRHSVMAGDHANDVAAAIGAGVPCIYAAWGYGRPEMREGAALVARSISELPDLAEQLLPA